MTTQAWDAYWADPAITNSFAFDYTETEGPYGVLNAFWLNVFSEFKHTDTIVDLAAGNGALATLFTQSRKDLNCASWINIDSASARPGKFPDKITFVQQNIEKLTLSDASVDYVVSMYGFEYSDITKSFAEIARCLKPQGHFAIFMHHPDAIITQQSHITIAAFKQVLADPFWQTLPSRKGLSYLELKNSLLQNLNLHLQSVSSNGQDDIKLIGQNIFYLLQSNNDVSLCIKHLVTLMQNIQLQVERLHQQIAAADNASKLSGLVEFNKQVSWQITTLDFQDTTLGYCFTGSKN